MTSTETTNFICLFHDPNRAEAALQALENAGFPRESIISLGSGASGYDGTEAASVNTLGAPERDLKHLCDGLDRGGAIVSLQAPESRSAEIERIFHKYNADKIDEADLDSTRDEQFAAPLAAATAESAVVPVVEEELLVGKREVDRGGVRVFRRVVEEPVAETLNLHDERVVIDRRPADRAVSAKDLAAAEQTIELTETAEVPVVTKTARVVEEVRVGLEETNHTETIKDTVRRTEVDVEPVPGSVRRTNDR